jgi:S-adenosyl-L-methionine hydrolase (adenosine-forming)
MGGCITLLSDFGLADASVASAKGILTQYMPGTPIIDISHQVEPFHLQQAAYLLLAAYRNFPKGTCHILLFDIFSESTPKLLLCEKDGHFFLAPDNGVLALALGRNIDRVSLYHEFGAEETIADWFKRAGALAATLQEKAPEDLQLPTCELRVAPHHWQPKVEPNAVECHVIHIDRFENVILNITKDQFEKIGRHRPFRIIFTRNEEITELSNHYNDVKAGEKLCRFNSTGYLEISINRGKAASLFALKLHREQHLMYNTIKIYFE